MILLVSFLLAQFVGWLSKWIRFPGAGVVTPMFSTAAIAILVADVIVPTWLRFAILVLMGSAIGCQVDRESLRAIRRLLVSATIASLAIMAVGVLAALLLRVLDLAPHGDMLATSPGALSAIVAASLENDYDTPTIAVFHIVRLMLIVASVPLLIRLIARPTTTDDGIDDGRGMAARVPTEPIGHSTTSSNVDVKEPLWAKTTAIGRFLLPTIGALVGATIGDALGVPVPIVVTAFLGASVVAVLIPSAAGLPKTVGLFLQSALAWLVGSLVTADTLAALGPVIAGAVTSSIALVLGGILIALGLRRLRLAPAGDVLATSPGALELLTLIADKHGAKPVDIGVFHLVRLLLVMLTLPVLLLWTR